MAALITPAALLFRDLVDGSMEIISSAQLDPAQAGADAISVAQLRTSEVHVGLSNKVSLCDEAGAEKAYVDNLGNFCGYPGALGGAITPANPPLSKLSRKSFMLAQWTSGTATSSTTLITWADMNGRVALDSSWLDTAAYSYYLLACCYRSLNLISCGVQIGTEAQGSSTMTPFWRVASNDMPTGFKKRTFPGGVETYTDYTAVVTDNNLGTHADMDLLDTVANNTWLICSFPQTHGSMYLTLGANKNAVVSALTVEYWNGAAWVSVGAVTDLTAIGGATLAQSGYVYWTSPGNLHLSSLINGLTAYHFRISVSVCLSATVDLDEVRVMDDFGLCASPPTGIRVWTARSSEIPATVLAGLPAGLCTAKANLKSDGTRTFYNHGWALEAVPK